LAEFQASFEEFEGEDEGKKELYLNEALEEVEEGLDEGELLVIRRALSGLASQDEFKQRESIFHIRCTVGGKVCSLSLMGGVVRMWPHNLWWTTQAVGDSTPKAIHHPMA